ncbi:type II toxin-antitoxin system RelE/ParE family toxin [Paradesulfitobacterium ferrireducens]|uniref:type II toxin-antitoxin system RelE/ParE family toxin n=1 Tax=Paradesulfitobacterium ferrireducens TaxID=2816476 RepID=UPI001A8DC5AF|nr:type II toxin-antitoxin system RelE/ParE family toxin [Paradesulfitobacterium ferrireducens]
MSKLKVTILQIAREDIAEIYFYIAADNPKSALALTGKIADKIDTLAEFPFIGKIVPDNELAKQEYRMLIIESHIVFYKVMGDEVIVYRVLHGMRDCPDLLV